MKTIKQFVEASNVPATLIRAVISGLGGWDAFKQSAIDVNNHGAAGGYGAFCYYSDTVKFTTKHKKAIVSLLEQDASDLGYGVVEMVQGCYSLKDDYDYDEVAKALYGRATENSKTYIYNALAWYALESVCSSYCYFVEEN